MKKLIALLSSVAIVASFSFSAMAASIPTALVNLTPGTDSNAVPQTMATTFDLDTKQFVTTVTGVTDQATLLVHSGILLTTDAGTNIQFIDQTTVGTTTSFTYKLKTDPIANDIFTIKVGGSNVADALSQKVQPIVQTAPLSYTITGSISNVAAVPDPEEYEEMEDPEELTAFLADSLDKWKTSVSLIPYTELNLLVKDYWDATTNLTETLIAPTVIATAGAGTFSLTVPALPSGTTSADYALVVRRNGYLAFFKKIHFQNDNIILTKPITLLAGDVLDNVDLGITSFDALKIFKNQSVYIQPQYLKLLDINADGSVTAQEALLVYKNINLGGYAVEYLEDGINLDELYEE